MKRKEVKLGDLEVGDVYYAHPDICYEYEIIAKRGNYVVSALRGTDTSPFTVAASETRWVAAPLTYADLKLGEFFQFVNLAGKCLRTINGYALVSYGYDEFCTDDASDDALVVRLEATFTEVDE